MKNSNLVKTPRPSFYGLETKAEVARHLRNIDFEYDPMKTAIAAWFDVPYNEVRNLPGYVPGAMDSTPQNALTGIALISGNALNEKGETTEDSVERDESFREARVPKLVPIPKAQKGGRKPLFANPSTFREGLWIVVAGYDPRILVFEDGHEINANGYATYGSGWSRVKSAITTYGSDIDVEQLFAWQQQGQRRT